MKINSFIDKSNWDEKYGRNEPDEAYWIDKSIGFCCVIRRNLVGALCGYVGIDHRHPYFNIEKNNSKFNSIIVHGGVTYTDYSFDKDSEFCPAIRRWWIGFDAAKDIDLIPLSPKSDSMIKYIHNPIEGAQYRTFDFMINETDQLAYQLGKLDSRIGL